MTMAKQIPVTFVYPALALPLKQAAECLGVSRATLWRLIRRGKIREIEDSPKLIATAELERYCRQ